MLLVYDAKSYTVQQIHHVYVAEFDVRAHTDDKLTPDSVILQDMSAYVLDSDGGLDPKRVTLVMACLKEDNNISDPDKYATITVSLSIASEKFRICLNTDNISGFPILSRVDPSSPLQTQIPMTTKHNCWMVANTIKNNGHLEPITANSA